MVGGGEGVSERAPHDEDGDEGHDPKKEGRNGTGNERTAVAKNGQPISGQLGS